MNNLKREFNSVFGSLEMYRRLVENLYTGIYVAEADGCLVYVNSSFAQILGYSSKDELIGLNMAHDIYGHLRDWDCFFKEVGKLGFFRGYEVTAKDKDGGVVLLSVTGNFIYDECGKVSGIQGTIFELYGHQKIFSRLPVLEDAIEQTADHIMITDTAGVIKYVNPSFEATTGYARHEAIGQTPRLLKSGKQDKNYYEALWSTILSGKTFHAQTTNKKKNGDLYVADQTISPVFNERREIVCFISVWKDYTNRYKAEQRLKADKIKLEEIIGFDEKISTFRKSDRLMDFVVTKIMSILDAEQCSIMLIEKEKKKLYRKASAGSNETDDPVIVEIKGSAAEQVIEDHRPLLVRSNAENGTKPLMIAPIRLEDEIIGVIHVTGKRSPLNEPASFDEGDLKNLCDIAREVAVAMENVRFYKELQFLTVTDPVTNIHNYRHFSNCLDYEIKRLKRTNGDLSLLMIDIDNFKAYDNEFGHPAQDKLLRDVGRVIQENLRESDVFCRYAADEFVVIMPGTGRTNSAIPAERIRQAVEKAEFERPMTISIGVAQYKAEMTAYDLTVKADRALYEAKKEGKNKIRIF